MASLDNYLYLLENHSKAIFFPQLSLDSGRDFEPTVLEGFGEVRMSSSSCFEYTLRGRSKDPAIVMKKLRGSQDNPYDTFEQFRLRGVDSEGANWMLGWTSPEFKAYEGDEWVLVGKVTGMTCDQMQLGDPESSVENVFEIPLHSPIAQVMKQVMFSRQRQGDPVSRERTLEILNTKIKFDFEPSTSILTVIAQTSSSFEHPYAENWLAEPFRIIFGQLLYPRLVARNFKDGRVMISIRRTHSYANKALYAALWSKVGNGISNSQENFWDLYGQILTYIAQTRDKNGHQNFEANSLTRFYEELIQATHGSRWVVALTLASIVEGQARLLIQPGEFRKDINEDEIESLCKHISEWSGCKKMSGYAINSVKQTKEITPTRLLVRFRDAGIVTASQVNSWKEIRNAVMHGKLISPWPTEEEDNKILDLANLVHSMSLEIIS